MCGLFGPQGRSTTIIAFSLDLVALLFRFYLISELKGMVFHSNLWEFPKGGTRKELNKFSFILICEFGQCEIPVFYAILKNPCKNCKLQKTAVNFLYIRIGQ